MKKMSILLGAAALASLSLASCQKELDQVQPADQQVAATQNQSKSELLTTSPWRLTGLTTTVASASKEASNVDLLARLKPAVRDNTFTYAIGGTYTVDEAALKSHPQAPQQFTGSWKLSTAGDSLTVTQDNTVRRYAVAELSGSTLRLSHTEAGPNGATFTRVYSH